MKDKNFSSENTMRELSPAQRQIELERQLEQKSECQVIEAQHNVSIEVWKQDSNTHLQILRNGLSKGCYGRLQYKGNPQKIHSDLIKALCLTCGMNDEMAGTVASELIEKLKTYERETFQRMKAQREQMMRAK